MTTLLDSQNDWRFIGHGREIPSEGYCDQPYMLKTDDGAWLCVITTGPGDEGQRGQHVVARRSTDQGRTWSEPVPIEPSGGPEASYAVLFKTPFGRIYAFYNHNTDRVSEFIDENGHMQRRVDSLGHYVFKYSDNGGRSWSADRYQVPVREFACDRENAYRGKLRFFWNVGKPVVHDGAMIMPHHKVGAMGSGFFAQNEGVFLRSDNILHERDPRRIRFETLPDGDVGLRAPRGGGRIAAEQSMVVLSDGSLYCVYRTIDGWPAESYSRDGGHTWSEPRYKVVAPGGRRMKNPRAANFVWRCANGRYLYWFHNHGGAAVRQRVEGWDGNRAYADRNPAWLSAGIERDAPEGKVLHWTQPEIVLYDDDPAVRMSYPDLLEDDGRYFLSETQKYVARVHELDLPTLKLLFRQFELSDVAIEGLLLRRADGTELVGAIDWPTLPWLTQPTDRGSMNRRTGFTIDLTLRLDRVDREQTVLDTRNGVGQGLRLAATTDGTLRLELSDGRTGAMWTSDRGMLRPGMRHHVSIIVDAGPRLILFVIDGVLNDGGDERQFGFGRFSPYLHHANGAATAQVAGDLTGAVTSLRVHGRALRVSEAVGNARAAAGAVTSAASSGRS